jgi:hypothetical protein
MRRIANQHPRLVNELARLVKGWESLTTEDHDAWVLDVLNGFDERGEYEIPSAKVSSGRPEILADTLTDVFLSRKEVSEWLAVHPGTLARYKLPTADATIGRARGWRKSTIVDWDASRPGRGRWKESR